MTRFELVKKRLTVKQMTEMLYLCDNQTAHWCTAREEGEDIVCDFDDCKSCIKKWLKSEVCNEV